MEGALGHTHRVRQDAAPVVGGKDDQDVFAVSALLIQMHTPLSILKWADKKNKQRKLFPLCATVSFSISFCFKREAGRRALCRVFSL